MVTITLEPEHGYVMLAAVGATLYNIYISIKVGKARKKYGVKYPTMYSDKSDVFNCYQRVHQNYLENLPQFYTMLLLGGIQHPCIASGASAVYLLGRHVYALGYYTGQPEKRVRGAFMHLGSLTLLGLSIKLALNTIGWL